MSKDLNAPLRLRDSEIIRMASLREEMRIAQLDEHFRADEEFILTAIVRGWSVEQAIQEYAQRRCPSGVNTANVRKAS
jgi:hypothetical protein